jgi:nucleoside-diphosphate-sugar epimerase
MTADSAQDVLLLGGSGLMGEPVARHLLAAGHRVTVLSRGESALPPGVASLRGDRGDAASLSAALQGVRFDFTLDLLAFDAADVERVLLLPNAVLGRYAMISSGQVYLVTDQPRPPFRESDADAPLMAEPAPGTRDHGEWAYGVGKRRAEAALRRLRVSHGVRGIALRLPVVQGAGDTRSRRLWAYLERLLDGGGLLLPDGGANLLRFVWAEDVARAVVQLVQGAWPAEAAYNLAQPQDVTLRELVTGCACELGVAPKLVDASAEWLAAHGFDHSLSPYSGRWCSRPDPTLAAEWGFHGTPWQEWLPQVVRAHRTGAPRVSHPGYAHRAQELAAIASIA